MPPSRGVRWAAIVACVLRFVLPIAAIPFGLNLLREDAASLEDGQLLLLLLLRPGKEVILAAGGLLNTQGGPPALASLLAFVPLGILASSAFFLLGRSFADRFREGDGPAWLAPMFPPGRLPVMLRLVANRGLTIAFLGRIFALPYTLLAGAAGTTRIRALPYLLADALGGVVSFFITLGIGYGLGEAYERAGTWFTVLLVVGVMVLTTLGSRWFEREAARDAAVEPALDTDIA